MNEIYFFTLSTLGACGVTLMALNLYGLVRDLEPVAPTSDEIYYSASGTRPRYQQFLRLAERLPSESDWDYAKRINNLVARRIVHIHWEKYPPKKFHQRVPVWENWLLWLLGLTKRSPHFRRYSFTDWRRIAKRGIGACGDKSMLLQQLLTKNKVECSIVSNQGHVYVQVKVCASHFCLDPDYGVYFKVSPAEILSNWDSVSQIYRQSGAREGNIEDLRVIFGRKFRLWGATHEFVRCRYIFERVSYFLKWPVPMIMVSAPFCFLQI